VAKLFGVLYGDQSQYEVTRCGHQAMHVSIQTWDGQVAMEVRADGGCVVTHRLLQGAAEPTVLWSGNINTGEEEKVK